MADRVKKTDACPTKNKRLGWEIRFYREKGTKHKKKLLHGEIESLNKRREKGRGSNFYLDKKASIRTS